RCCAHAEGALAQKGAWSSLARRGGAVPG
ncbi:Protein of unknown function, partial [Gryllus bimaculatus]